MAKTSSSSSKNPPAKAGTSVKKASKKSSESCSGSNKGPSAKDKILELAADSYCREEESLSRDRLIKEGNMAAKTVANNITKLKNEGLIECLDGQCLRLTAKGVESMGDKAKILSKEERQERLKKDLKGKQLTLFELLSNGDALDRDELAKELGFEQGKKQKGFMNLLGIMRGKSMLEYPDKSTVQLSEAYIVKS